MDQIFGEENNLGTIIWDKNQGSAGSHMTATHEYVLVYAKNKRKAPPLYKRKPSAQMMLAKARELKTRQSAVSRSSKIFKNGCLRWNEMVSLALVSHLISNSIQ